jgi:predicted acyltransferase
MSRDSGLDFLRGIAIFGMVLSGTISRNPELPGWLFHAQVGPPDFVFNPNNPGITWVDLVFPFFLFAMGMAIPLSLQKLLDKGKSQTSIIKKLFLRSLKLWFFAVMLGHLSVFHYPAEAGYWACLLAALAFCGFFLAFLDFRNFSPYGKWWNAAGFLLLISLGFIRQWAFDEAFSLQKNDIIILVLANMAFWAGAIWLFSRSNIIIRLGIIALYFGLRLTQGIEGSWNQELWNFLPLWWLAEQIPAFGNLLTSIGLETGKTIFYHPDYLKYLMIVLPGTIAGDLVMKYKGAITFPSLSKTLIPAGAMILLILLNLVGLYLRWLTPNLIISLLILIVIYQQFQRKDFDRQKMLRQLASWAIFWVLLGLVFEAWQGGIKKDSATYSYFFLTSGFSIFLYMTFSMLHKDSAKNAWWNPLVAIGQNPMLAYVAVAYLIIPVIGAIQLLSPLDGLHEQWKWFGLMRGLFLTAVMMALTVFSVRKKLFWKT